MKFFTVSLLFFLLNSAPSLNARVVTADRAPYIARSGSEQAIEREHIEPLARSQACESVIHKRVAKHLRPDWSVDKRQHQRRDGVLGPVADDGSITDFKGKKPQPVRGQKGFPFLHGSNSVIDKQNIDNISPPPTDAGVVPNLKWSFSLSHTKLLKGGWVREQVVTDLPVSKDVAAAEQSLAPFAYRELHWHRVAEWAYVINGTVRITGNDEDGKSFVADAKKGDLWSFNVGIPHSLQAGPEGAQYLLVFDDGDFDASGTTFMVDDWIAHTPRDVLAENFGWNASAFDNVPATDPYIVAADSWPSLSEARKAVSSPLGEVDAPYVYELSKQDPTEAPGGGGWVKTTDYRQFPASPTLASALIHVKPGAIRELHWHKEAEWGYILSGKARATAFAGGATARTFELQAGDTWVFPTNFGHYIQNIDENEPLEFLEIFRGPNFGDKVKFNDFSLTQWLALTPPEFVSRQLNVSRTLVDQLKKEKPILVAKQS